VLGGLTVTIEQATSTIIGGLTATIDHVSSALLDRN
jgi:hypothetical protein